jgi:hypothetical protein
MKIQQFNTEKKGSFKAMEENNIAGELVYTWAGKDKFIIEHTEVDEKYAGKSIGKKLVFEAVNFARNNHLKIIPLCPFAKALFEKLPELKDVEF